MKVEYWEKLNSTQKKRKKEKSFSQNFKNVNNEKSSTNVKEWKTVHLEINLMLKKYTSGRNKN